MVRGGIIGCGDVVEDLHMPAWGGLPEVKIEALCDVQHGRLESMAARHQIANVYTNADDLLAKHKDLGFIVVATPGFTHYEICKKVINSGFNLLVEKPISLDLREVIDLRDRAAEAGVKVCVLHTWRFRNPIVKAQEALKKGLLGQLYQVTLTHHGESLFHSLSSWKWQERRNRVLLYEFAFHFLDLQVLFAGPVRKIHGLKVLSDPHLDCTTHLYALVEHESGVIANVDLQLFASSNFSHLELFGTANDIKIKFFPYYYRLYSGRVNPIDELYFDFLRVKEFVLPILIGKVKKPLVKRRALPHYEVFRQFIRSIHDDSYPVPVSIESTIATMAYLEELASKVYRD